MTTTGPRSPLPGLSAAPRKARWKLVVLLIVGFIALLLLALSVVVHIARGEIRTRLSEAAARFGLEVEIGSVEIPIFGGIGLTDLAVYTSAPAASVSSPSSAASTSATSPSTPSTPSPTAGRRLVAELDRVETDITLLSAAGGQRRPDHVVISGGRATLRWADGLIDLTRSPAPTASEAPSATTPMTVAVSGLDLVVEASQSTPAGLVRARTFAMTGLSLALSRDADRELVIETSGSLVSAGATTPVDLRLDTRAQTLSFESTGAEVHFETPRGELAMALSNLAFAPASGLTVTDAGLALGDDRLAFGKLDARFANTLALGLPDPLSITSLDLTSLRVARLAPLAPTSAEARPDARLDIGKTHIVFAPSALLPTPTGATLSALSGTVRDPARGQIKVTSDNLELGFADTKDLALLIALGSSTSPLDALTELAMARPTIDIRLATSLSALAAPTPDVPSPEPGAPAAPAPSDAPANDPPPILGNDEDLPPVERVVPAFAPGQDWLGALLGSADTGQSGSLLDLIPEAWRTRLPALLNRLAVLSPRIDDAAVTVRASDNQPLLILEDAGFSARRSDAGVVLAARAAIHRKGAAGADPTAPPSNPNATTEAARLDFEVTVSDTLDIESVKGRASGRSLANQLARFVRGLSVEDDAEVDLTLNYTRPVDENAPHHVEGVVAVSNFSFEFWRISDREITDLQAKATFDASIDRKAHRLLLSLPRIEVGESHFTASLDLTRKANSLPRFVATVEMPRQDCGAAGRSIPKALIPNLSTLELRGQMAFVMSLDLDLANPRNLTLRVTGDTSGCEAVSLGPGIDPTELRGPYVHRPREPVRGVLEHIRVGPGTREWVPEHRIPKLVSAAAWITEDRRYSEHGGVRWDLVQTALKMDLDHGRFIYGGSTITQQLVKNLYLSRDKNLARKLEEMIIAWRMERVLTKEEILTLYVNCIEYGPDIYGIRQAARAYFDKRVDDLDPLETAFIMGLKPYPKAGYNQFLKGQLDIWWVRRVSYVLRLMAKYEPLLLSAEEAEAFDPFQPKFRAPPMGDGNDGSPEAPTPDP